MIKKIQWRNVIQKTINRLFWNIRNGCRIEKNLKNQKLKIDGFGMQEKVS